MWSRKLSSVRRLKICCLVYFNIPQRKVFASILGTEGNLSQDTCNKLFVTSLKGVNLLVTRCFFGQFLTKLNGLGSRCGLQRDTWTCGCCGGKGWETRPRTSTKRPIADLPNHTRNHLVHVVVFRTCRQISTTVSRLFTRWTPCVAVVVIWARRYFLLCTVYGHF